MATHHNPTSAQSERAAPSGLLRRVAVAIAGVVVVLIGIPLIPLFGPGWLIVFSGLAILASEFEWAGRLRDRIRSKFRTLVGDRTDS
ncbi:MAG: hypothetical protein GY720_02990 [bacterium]|nr:hypothetical protein [bacterium]